MGTRSRHQWRNLRRWIGGSSGRRPRGKTRARPQRATTRRGGPNTACHSESECATCHAGQSVPSAFHGAGYALLHAAEASRDAASCASCHSVSQFCRDCHTTSAVDVDSAFLAPGVDAHPPGWSLPGDPSHHGDAARRDLVSCVSCHNDQSCTTCHADISPHGGDFWYRCANLQRQSPDMCAQCHVANTPRCGMP
jgi:hypothetical protein